MNRKTILTVFLSTILAAGLQGTIVSAQEHPEHPTKSKKAEHPKHAEQSRKLSPVNPSDKGTKAEHPEHPEHPAKAMPAPSIDEVAAFITTHVNNTVADDKGYMKVEDKKTHKTISVKLDHVHRERLARTDDNTYFVCADFKDHQGKLYDLDFWVKQTPSGLHVTETMIHKEAGAPRYTWFEKDGVWRQEKTK